MLLSLLRNAVRGRRETGDQLLQQGLALQSAGDLHGAERAYREVLGRDPGDRNAAHLLGVLLHRDGRLVDALAMLERASTAGPASPELQVHRAAALNDAERFDEAARALQAALAAAPDFLPAHIALGLLWKRQGRLDDALAALDRAVEIRPDSAEAWHNRANVLRERNEEERARESFDRALALKPDLLEARFSRALSLLASGRLEEGWREHEVRLQMPRLAKNLRPFTQPAWQGEPLAGKHLLVWSEQGVGDELMHANMIPDLIDAGARLTVEVSAKLVPVFARSFPEARVVARTQPAHAATAEAGLQISSLSLPRYLRPSLDRFPAHADFLRAAPERLAFWQATLQSLGPGLKVGFCWRSTDLSGERALACAKLGQWDALLATPGVHWVSLQYDECSAELDAARARTGLEFTRYDLDYFNDLDEVSALTRALDLVISAPTAVSVHAAALGVRTWQLAYGADWQMHGTANVPWLPSLRRHPRHWNESWEDVLARLAAPLRTLAGANGR